MIIHQPGAGGVGFYLTPSLVRAGVKDIVVYDTDTLEGGLGHMRLPRATPTTKKIALLKGFIVASMGDLTTGVTFVDKLFTGEEVEKGDLVLDCTDMSLTNRKPMYERVVGNGARYLRINYDGHNGGTVVVAEGLPLAGRPNGGYTEMPDMALSQFAGGVGARVVQDIIAGKLDFHIEFQISLSDYLIDWNKKPATEEKHDKDTDRKELPAQPKKQRRSKATT